MDKINIVTLGCSKNLVDSEVLMGQLKNKNTELIYDSNDLSAKTVIINTCGFIGDAKQESIETILRFAKAKESGEIDNLFVMGCLSERYKDDLKNEISEVDKYFGVNDISEIAKTINIDYKKELIGERYIKENSHFAYVKISEGCDRNCSFCAIPLIRGKHISRPIEEIIKEAEYLVRNGIKELILIAQDLTYYGIDIYKKNSLSELLIKLSDVKGVEWIRLHYAYPSKFPMDVLKVIREKHNICKYLDIPVQHISDNVLDNMRRGISKEQTISLLDKIRTEIPGIAIRTTIMVGHPGESKKEFDELKKFVKDAKFDRLGVFTYSEEEDTWGADNLKDKISQKEKDRREEEIMSIQEGISGSINSSKIGKTFKVIIDREEGDYFIGRTEYDSPEVDNEVLISNKNQKMKVGNFYNIQITDSDFFDLYGELI